MPAVGPSTNPSTYLFTSEEILQFTDPISLSVMNRPAEIIHDHNSAKHIFELKSIISPLHSHFNSWGDITDYACSLCRLKFTYIKIIAPGEEDDLIGRIACYKNSQQYLDAEQQEALSNARFSQNAESRIPQGSIFFDSHEQEFLEAANANKGYLSKENLLRIFNHRPIDKNELLPGKAYPNNFEWLKDSLMRFLKDFLNFLVEIFTCGQTDL